MIIIQRIKLYTRGYVVSLFNRLRALSQKGEYNFYCSKYHLPSTLKFNGEGIKFYGEGEIIIGDHTYIGQFSFLQSSLGCKIEIGRNCAISHNVKIYTTSYVSDQDFIQTERKVHKANVKIGDGVWIGVNVLINPGITIGNNAIVGANSVVTKDIPASGIAGGVPARIIRFKNIPGA